MPRVFNLMAYQPRNETLNVVLITPEETDPNIVVSAWSYAVRYTAKALDLPDHEAALALLTERHPSWQLIHSQVQNIPVMLNKAELDKPESE